MVPRSFPPIALSSFAFIALLALAILTNSPARAETIVRLPGHISRMTPQANRIGRMSVGERVDLRLVLPNRDEAGLRSLLNSLYTPGGPLHGHFLTPDEYTARFGPTPADYDRVVQFAKSRGLTITATPSNRRFVGVAGNAGVVETAFGVHMMRFRTSGGRVFHAPDTDPAIPAELAGSLSHVAGLDNGAIMRPFDHPATTRRAPALLGAAPGGGLAPADIRAAYNLPGVAVNGAGQSLALFEMDGYAASDVTAYESQYGLRNVPLTNVLLDGFSGLKQTDVGAREVTVDIELAAALAPGLRQIIVYEAPNDGSSTLDLFNQIAVDDAAKQVSASWGVPEGEMSQGDLDSENSIFQQMAAQGQTMFAASGDLGAYDNPNSNSLAVDDPSSQPYVTGVGGTTLTTLASSVYVSETTWLNCSGGGCSSVWGKPAYQSGLGASTTMRNSPDVSLNSGAGYSCYYNGGFIGIGGTSCAAPLWAAFTALVNQQRGIVGAPPLGFANPSLYRIGRSVNYSLDFHDIADGSSNRFYTAAVGFDDTTGWGSFRGASLLADLVGASSLNVILSIEPGSVVGGTSVSGKITLSSAAPAGGATITLSSDNPATAFVLASVLVPGNARSATFTVSTSAVASTSVVNISATDGGATTHTALTVTPALEATFTSSATGPTSPVAPGSTVPITLIITDTSGSLSGGIVDIELRNANNVMLEQQSVTGQSFSAGQSQRYACNLTAPATPGAYSVMIGVYGSSGQTWTPLYYWNNQAVSVIVPSTNTLLWQNTGTGMVVFWGMSGTQVTNNQQVVVGSMPAGWRVAGRPDMNGDGQPDLLWENTQTGMVVYWAMSGTAITSDQRVVVGSMPQGWIIVGTPDMTGTGHPGLLWQNIQTGMAVFWAMNGTTITSDQSVVVGAMPAGWRIVGTPDLTETGSPGLLWENTQTGTVVFWAMSGTQVTSDQRVVVGSMPQGWLIVGAPDMTGTGNPGLLWENTQTSTVAFWAMNGASVTGDQRVVVGSMPQGWLVAPDLTSGL